MWKHCNDGVNAPVKLALGTNHFLSEKEPELRKSELGVSELWV
jgi:hypothetical protein